MLSQQRRTVGLCQLLLLLWDAQGAVAGDGLVALQTADPSCPDGSGNIYVDCGNGTVTDSRTGLIWLQDANCLNGTVSWFTAMEFAAGLSDKPALGLPVAAHDCGLTDGSSPGEWRLPSVAEWDAMIADALGQGGDPDCRASPPTITDDSGSGCWVNGTSGFSGVQSSGYWSSTTNVTTPANAWGVSLLSGGVGSAFKGLPFYVWPVRGGQ
ncbi:MAG: DUF1566 domain-containing protein [Thermoanaerobaculia bacterium]